MVKTNRWTLHTIYNI